MAKTQSLILVCLLAVVLSACSSRPRLPDEAADEAAWVEHSRQLAQVQAWSLDGRVALRTEDDGWTASLRWSQWSDFMEFRLRGSFGVGSTRVRGTPERMVVENSRGESWTTTDPEAELALETGWRVPLSSLRWWMIGLPAPGSEPETRRVNGDGHLVLLEQDGWSIYYEDYAVREGVALPGKLLIESEGIELRVRIRDWVVGARSEPGQSGLPVTDDGQ